MAEKFLGEFGVEHEDTDITFGYFGNVLRVHPDAGQLTYMDYMVKAMAIDDSNQTEGVRITMDFLQKQIHPDDWELFWTTAQKKRQTLEELMRLSKVIVEVTSGFPTTQPSDLSPTPVETGKKSKAGSSRQDKPRAIEQVPLLEQAYEILEGRPDLMAAAAKANGVLQ